ncbi:MAG: hypothetical protein AB7Y46_10095 [Armatimonadota bacterium]
MIRRMVMVLALMAATSAAAWSQEADARARAADLVRASEELADAGERAAALQKLLEALELAPDYPSIHAHMGYLYELEGEPLKALASYGRLLELQPEDEYGRSRIRHLFFGGPFPHRLRLSLLQFSPVSFVTDECRVRFSEGVEELRRPLAYTRGVIYPEAMGDHGEPVEIEIPSAGGQGVVGTAQFNRVCYGFVAAAQGEDLTLTAMVHYPSPLLSAHQADYSELAGRVTHILLRMHCYSRACYGLPVATDEQRIPRVWLCESGPTGAEQYDDDIFLYDVMRDRQPMEWLREVAHEWGHYALPRMGRFTQPEPYASGVLGEALFLQLLADEAGLVVGEPWPGRRAQAAVDGLWGNARAELAEYLAQMRESTLDLWLARGPNSELAAGMGEESFHYLVGAMLWVEAAHGHAMLRETLLKAPGESPADFYYGYRQAVREAAGKGEIELLAGGFDPSRSQLTQPPREGALRREEVQLGPGDHVQFPVYLLEGPAAVRITPGLRPTRLSLYIDGVGPLPVEGGEAVSLGQREQGWHTLALQAPEQCEPIPLRSLVIKTGEPQLPAPGVEE